MRRLTRRRAALAGAALLGAGGAVVLAVGLAGPATRTDAVLPVSAPVTTTAAPSAAPGPPPAPAPTPAAHWTPSSETHVLVPAVGLDLPLLPLEPDDGVINPPLLTAAYWIEPYGAPVAAADQAANTLYIAAHAAGHGDDGFDPLIAGSRSSAVGPGDVVEVRTPGGTVTYTVESTARYAKDALPDAADVWTTEPGRLVLITCFQRAGGPAATENLVVVAHS